MRTSRRQLWKVSLRA